MEVTDYLEEDNHFCIACHLHEEIFKNFMTDTPRLVALAGAHLHKGEVKCIDCHIGATHTDKLIIKAMAGWDTVQYFIGNFKEPRSSTLSAGRPHLPQMSYGWRAVEDACGCLSQ